MGLVDTPYERPRPGGFGDFVFRCDFDVISSTTSLRQAGFGDIEDSEAMFARHFAELRRRKIIP